MKIVSPDILHKTDAGGVDRRASRAPPTYGPRSARSSSNARAYDADARIEGVQVQQLLPPGQEVIVGAVTDPTFGKVVAFGLGGVLVEVLKDVTFRLAPVTPDEALSMLDSHPGGGDPARACAARRPWTGGRSPSRSVGSPNWSRDFPEIAEVDLNPVIATPDGAVAADIRIILADGQPAERRRRTRARRSSPRCAG